MAFKDMCVFDWTRWAAKRLVRVKVNSRDLPDVEEEACGSIVPVQSHSKDAFKNGIGGRRWRCLNSSSDKFEYTVYVLKSSSQSQARNQCCILAVLYRDVC